MKVTTDIINDWNFYSKLRHNFVSPKKIFKFVQIIFCTLKSPPYHTKFLQYFYNNLNILERNFGIVEDLYTDLNQNLTFHESFNNFNSKLNVIKVDNPDRSKFFNYGLVKPRKEAYEHFFLYVNYHRGEFEKIKSQIKLLVKEINTYPQMIENDENIKKVEFEEGDLIVTYIGEMNNNIMEGKGILVEKYKSNGNVNSMYTGEFKDGKRHGLGIFKTEEYQVEGNFLEDKLDGKIGIYYDDKLEVVEYKNDVINGRKITFSKNGNIITTSFENGMKNNNISIYLKKSNKLFTGEMKENLTYQGIIYGSNETSIQVGNFNSDFLLFGEGYLYSNNYGLYSKFDNGNIVPSLSYKICEDGNVFSGFCNQNGEMNGQNVLHLIYTNDEYKGDLFIGTLVNGKKIGYGEYYWGDGDYEKAISPNGWGIRYFAKKENNKYNSEDYYIEGNLHGGFAQGKGFLTYDGTRYSGLYKLNEKRCLFISDNGKSFRIEVSHDARFNEATAKQFKIENYN